MDFLKPRSSSGAPIDTLQLLSKTLSIPEPDLLSIAALSPDEKYRLIKIPKGDGSYRRVYSLHPKMRFVQGRINTRIFKELTLFPDYLFGSVPNKNDPAKEDIKRDYISCASLHCGAKTLLKVDIKDFFDNIHQDLVRDIFKDIFKIDREALDYISDICCKDGFVVQGALTSSYLATLCLYRKEHDVVKRARRKSLVYTRLVDDITVSTKVSNYDFSQIKSHIDSMLAEHDLPVNNNKTKIYYSSSQPLKVHGLRVDFNTPRLPSDEVKRIRASVHNISELSKKNNTKTSVAYRKEYNRCMGRVHKLKRVGHEKYSVFIKKLKAIKPLPSHRDVKIAVSAVESLELSFGKGNNHKNWYERKYDLAIYKLIILGRADAFSQLVSDLRKRLKGIKPHGR